jgi:hypothetical protein
MVGREGRMLCVDNYSAFFGTCMLFVVVMGWVEVRLGNEWVFIVYN